MQSTIKSLCFVFFAVATFYQIKLLASTANILSVNSHAEHVLEDTNFYSSTADHKASSPPSFIHDEIIGYKPPNTIGTSEDVSNIKIPMNIRESPDGTVYRASEVATMSATLVSSKSIPPRISVVAYVISITSCAEVLDGAAVLAESIRATQEPPFDLVALVNQKSTTCQGSLEILGYQVRVKELPFAVENLTSGEAIAMGTGCCGIDEFLKLYAFDMVEYQVVIHLDVDALVLKPLTPLVDAVLGRTNDIRTIPANQTVSPNVDFLFVREYKTFNPSEPTNRIKNGIQGAFFVVRPSQERFQHLIQILKDTPYFFDNRGWNAERFGGYWGSAQIQGFLSYYYARHATNGEGVELDPCRYNTLGFDLRYLPLEALLFAKNLKIKSAPVTDAMLNNHTCRTGEAVCEDCSITNPDEVFVVHLSRCYKPWWCRAYIYDPETTVCDAAMKVWFDLRGKVDDKLGNERPEWPQSPYYAYNVTQGYCQKRGKDGYVHLRLFNA